MTNTYFCLRRQPAEVGGMDGLILMGYYIFHRRSNIFGSTEKDTVVGCALLPNDRTALAMKA